MKVLVAQSCPALCDPMDCSPPGSSVHEILQARILKWAAILFSGDLSHPGIKPTSRTLQVDSLLSEPPVTNICLYVRYIILFIIGMFWSCMSGLPRIVETLFKVNPLNTKEFPPQYSHMQTDLSLMTV